MIVITDITPVPVVVYYRHDPLLQLPTPTMSVGVGRIFQSFCLSVCPQHNSKTNDPKVFKLGAGNDLGIYLK